MITSWSALRLTIVLFRSSLVALCFLTLLDANIASAIPWDAPTPPREEQLPATLCPGFPTSSAFASRAVDAGNAGDWDAALLAGHLALDLGCVTTDLVHLVAWAHLQRHSLDDGIRRFRGIAKAGAAAQDPALEGLGWLGLTLVQAGNPVLLENVALSEAMVLSLLPDTEAADLASLTLAEPQRCIEPESRRDSITRKTS